MKKLLPLLIAVFLAGCGYRIVPSDLIPGEGWVRGMRPGMGPGGTAWGSGAFGSNGERIYFTGTNEDDQRISYSGGPSSGMMMGGYLSCASCHGPDGRGGLHRMHMDLMDAPDIRWSSLAGEAGPEEAEEHGEHDHAEAHAGYDLETFQMAVIEGRHPDGARLSDDMPRWRLSDADLEDLAEFLKSLP